MNLPGIEREPERGPQGFRLKPLAWSVQVALLPGLIAATVPAGVMAAPTGGQVKAGSGIITQNASHSLTTINQHSQRVAIDWQGFDVARHEQVRFHQPNARSTALNRIFDQKPSEIFGQVKANGQVVLMNPNGVFFKPGAEVNVGGLIAGAMQIGIDDFMSGRYTLEALREGGGKVVNEGRIEAAPGGEVALVGKSVANEGVIVATAGKVDLVAGEQVTVDFDGDGLLRFAVDRAVIENAEALDDQVVNNGQIIADGGEVLITASAAEGVFKNAINNAGLIRAGKVERSGGKIMLVGMGPGASVLNTGQIDASAASAGANGGHIGITATDIESSGVLRADSSAGRAGEVALESTATTLVSGTVSAASSAGAGGKVKLLGAQVGLTGTAEVDVSGGTNGGEALIGGDFQGRNPQVRNARETYVGEDVDIAADAGEQGDGGKVIVWADETTRYFGDISARGGKVRGDGGNVEVSGKRNLTFAGFVDASALNGAPGTLLLDPEDFYIVVSGAPAAAPGATLDATNPFAATTAQEFYAEEATIEAIAAGTAISFTADNDIIFESDVVLNLAQNDNVLVSFTAGNSIAMSGADIIMTNGGDIEMTATAGSITTGGITTNGGDVEFNIGTALSVSEALNAGAGTVDILPAATSDAKFAIGSAGTGIDITNASLTNITAATVTIGNSATDAVLVLGVTGAATAGIGNLVINATEGGGSEGTITFDVGNSVFNANTALSLNAREGVLIDDIAVTVNGALTIDTDTENDGSGDFTMTNGTASALIVTQAATTITAAEVVIEDLGIDASGQTLTFINSEGDGMGLGGTALGGYRIANTELALISAATLRLNANPGGSNITVNGISAASSDTVAATQLLSSGGVVNFATAVSTFENQLLVAADAIFVNAGAGLVLNNGDLTLNSNIDGTFVTAIDVGVNAITIGGLTAGRQIDVGASNGGDIRISDAELGLITAGTLDIGGTNVDNIRVEAVTAANTDTIAQINLLAGQAAGSIFFQDVANVFENGITATASTVSINAGSPLTSNLGDITVTATDGALTVAAAVTASAVGGDIRLETQESAELTVATLTVNAALSAAGDNIGLFSADGITQGGGGTLTADGLAIQADSAAGLSFPASVARLAANITGAGNGFTFSNGTALDITTVLGLVGVTTNDGAISLTATTGALTLSQLVDAGTSTVGLTATAGAIVDGNAASANVLGDSLSASAATGIDLDTTVTTLTSANVTGVGAIDISDTLGGLAVTSATTTDGLITLNATAGDLAVTTVTAGGANDAILTTTTSGNITLGVVTATGDDVFLTAAGAVTDTNAATANVVANTLTAGAATGIDTDTTITTLTSANVTGAGAINLSDTDALAVSSATTANGEITLSTLDGALTVNGAVTASGAGSDVSLSTAELAEGTNATLDINALVTAADDISLTSADDITDDGTGAAEVAGDALTATAATGIDLDTTITTLTSASVTGAGAINITDSDALAVAGAATTNGSISLSTINGALTIDGAVTAAGAGNDASLTAAETVEGTDATLDINALVTAADDISLISADGITDDGTGAAEVAGDSLTVTSATGTNLDTTITTLTSADVTGIGAIDISDTAGGLAVTSATTSNGNITLNATGGTLAVTTVTAVGTGRDISLTTTTSGNITLDGAVTATGDDVEIRAAGNINQTGTGSITAVGLGLEGGSITLGGTQSDIDTLAANLIAAGNFTFTDQTDLIVGTVGSIVGVTTLDGSITIDTVEGSLTVNDAVTANGATRDVSLTTAETIEGTDATLDINALVTAADDISLTSADGITDDGTGAAEVAGDSLTVTSATGTNLDTTITTLANADVTGTGAIDISDTAGGLAVTSATTNDGAITLNATGGTLALGTVTANGVGRDISLTTTTSGDITLANDVTATGDDIEIRAAGNINQTAGGLFSSGLGLQGGSITLGGTQSDIDTLAANLTQAGNFTFSDLTDLTIGTVGAIVGVTTSNGSITIDTVNGFLTVDSATTANGAGNDVSLSAGETAEGTNASLDINALVTAADNVILVSEDNITDGGTAASEVSADALTVTAATGIDLDTTITTLTSADVTGTGAINISDTNALLVSSATTTSGAITLSTVDGALTVNGAVTANGAGSDVSLSTAELAEGTNATLDINALVTAADDVSLSSADDITDDGTGAAEIVADALSATAATGIDLDTTITTLTTANVTGTGAINLSDTDALAVSGATTANGGITLSTLDGALTVNGAVTASGAGSDVSLSTAELAEGTNATLDINALVTAADDISLTSADDITDNGTGAAEVAGDALTATAATGIDLDTTITTLTSASVTGTGAINISDTNALLVSSATTTSGAITLSTVDGALTVNGAVTANGAGNDVSLSTAELAEGTNATLDINALVTAADDISLTSADDITDGGTGAAEIVADALSATAATGIDLDTTITTLTTANVTGTGAINLSDTDALAVSGATTANGGITLSTLDGALTVNGAVTASGAGSDVSLSTAELAEGTNATLDINALVTAADDISLTSADDITDNGTGAAEVAGDALTATAATGIDLDTTITTLTSASVTGTGAINISDTNALLVSSATTTSGAITLSTVDGALTVNGAVTANGAGNDVSLSTAELAEGTNATLDINALVTAADDISLTSADDITDGGTGAAEIVADALSATAATGIDLDMTITTLTTANVTGTGAINLSDTAGGLDVTSATTNDGAITLNATGGTLALGTVTANGVGRDISLTTTTSGDITLANDVTATGDDIEIRAAGNINQTAGGLFSSGLGLQGGSITLGGTQSDIDTLAANLTQAGNFTFSDLTDLTIGTIGAIVGVTTSNGSITIDTVNGFLTVDSATTANGAGNDVSLSAGETAEGTNATLDINALVTAADDVILVSEDNITDGGTAASEVSADALTVTAVTGIDLDTTITTLTSADVTGTGAINISDTNALLVSSATTTSGAITLSTVDGALTVNGAVTANGAGNDVSLSTAELAEGTNATLDINALVTAADDVSLSSADDITDDGTGAVDIVADALSATAATGIDLDTTITTLTTANVTGTGAINLSDTDALAVSGATTANGGITLSTLDGALTVNGAVTASGAGSDVSLSTAELAEGTNATLDINALVTAADDISLTSADDITDNGTGAAEVAGDALTATAATGIDLDTTITTLTSASVTGTGAINISDTNALLVSSATTTSGAITLSTVDGALTVNGAVTANGAGSDVSLSTAELAEGTNATLDINALVTAADDVSLSSADGITDDGTGAAEIVADALSATAATGIDLDTTITTLTTANVTGTGAINLSDTDALAVSGATTANGGITLSTLDGALTVNGAVTASGAGSDVSLSTAELAEGTNATLDINALVTAADDISLTSADDITDNGTGAAEVAGDALTATAATGIDLDTTITTLTSASVTGTGAINISDTNALLVSSATTTSGAITLSTVDGALTVNGAVTANGAGNDVSLSTAELAEGTNATLDINALVTAADDISLTSADDITDGGTGAAEIVADALSATAATGIDLDMTITTLTTANVTGAGAINLSDTDALAVSGATTANGGITLSTLDGALTVNGAVTASGAGSDVSLSTAELAEGTNATLDINALVTAADDISLTSADDITDDGTGAAEVAGDALTATAATGIDLDTTITTLTSANVTGTGDIDITETAAGMSVTSATTADGNITLLSNGGTLSVATATAGGAGRDISLATTTSGNIALTNAITAAGDDVLLDSAGNINQTGGAVTAVNLELSSVNAVTLTSATNAVTTVAGTVTANGQGFAYTDSNDLVVGTVNATSGITTQNGAIAVEFAQNGAAATVDIDDTIDAGTSSIAVTGAAGADVFNLNASLTEGAGSSLNGAGASDSFVFADTFAADTVNGGGQTGAGDVLDLSNYTGAITFTLSAADTGTTSGALTTDFNNVERLISGSNAGDTLSAASAGAPVTFTITGANQGTTSLLTGTAPSWQNIENLTGSASPDSFVLSGGDLSGGINGGQGADTFQLGAGTIGGLINGGGGSDTLTGRNQVSTWTLTATGAGTIDDTPVGAPDGAAEFSFSAMEILQGGSNVDTFNATSGTALSFTELRGGANADIFNIVKGAASTILTADIIGEGGGDTVFFGVNEPGAPVTDVDEHSRLVGFIDLGAGFDTINFSGSDLLLVTTTTNLNTGSGQSGTITDLVLAVTDPDPPDVALITTAPGDDGFFDVDDLKGNGSQLQGTNDDTVWVITGFGQGRRGADLDSATLTFENFSIRGGNKRDFFIFKDETGITPQLALGIDGGDVIAGNATTHNYILGSDGSDTFGGIDQYNIAGTNTLTITVNGAGGTATTFAVNINVIGDAGIALTGGAGAFNDSAADSVTIQAGVEWNGDIFTNGGADTVTFEDGASLAGTLDMGAGTDTADLSAYTSGLQATINAIAATGMGSVNSNFAGGFAGIEVLNTGSGNDTITASVAPVSNVNSIDFGGGGGDRLASTVDASWEITANGTGFLRDVPANVANQLSFTAVENLSTTQDAQLLMPSTAGTAASIAGTFTADNIEILPTTGTARSVFAGNLGLRMDGNVSSQGSLTLDADGGGIDIDGALTSQAALTIDADSGGIAVSGALTTQGALNLVADGGGTIDLGGAVTSQGAITFDANGGGDIEVAGALDSGGPLNLQADGAGDITVNGDILVDGAFVSSVGAGTASYQDVGASTDRTGNQTYSGQTVLRGDLFGASLRFNDDVAISGNVLLSSNSNTFDFRREVTSGTDDILSIEPPAGNDIFIDNELGAGHIAADAFDGFLGTLVIGGQFAPGTGANPSVVDGIMVTATADYILVTESFVTGGNLLLIGSAIEFDPNPGVQLEVAAGPPGGGEIILLALGDSVQPLNDGLGGTDNFGDIVGPATGTMTFTGGSALFAAVGEIVNAGSMIMDLGGGEVTLAQSAQAANTQIAFNVQSDAQSSNTDVFDTELVDSLIDVAQVQAAPNPFTSNSFQNTRASFPNPAAVLTILQAVSFVDSSLFEEDLSLFGVIGNGIALSLDQCEDAEGCAPSVTEEELAALIGTLNERIARIEALLASGEMDAAEGERLLAAYRVELQNFLNYQEDLKAYNARQEADEFGDDFGEEFDDVFEAEETLEPAADEPGDEPAADVPAEDVFEDIEESAETLDEAPAEEPADAAPAEDVFEDLEESVETLDEAPLEEPAATPAPEETEEPAFDELDDEFEELEEELDDSLLNQIMQPGQVNQLAGIVRVDVSGNVVWAGDIVLPTLHRRY